jgi:hypothetical protein
LKRAYSIAKSLPFSPQPLFQKENPLNRRFEFLDFFIRQARKLARSLGGGHFLPKGYFKVRRFQKN